MANLNGVMSLCMESRKSKLILPADWRKAVREWLYVNDISYEALAYFIGSELSTLYAIISGNQLCKLKVALDIATVTNIDLVINDKVILNYADLASKKVKHDFSKLHRNKNSLVIVETSLDANDKEVLNYKSRDAELTKAVKFVRDNMETKFVLPESFCIEFSEMRKSLGIRLEDIASYLSISPTMIEAVINGHKSCSYNIARLLACLFKESGGIILSRSMYYDGEYNIRGRKERAKVDLKEVIDSIPYGLIKLNEDVKH